MCYNLNTNVVVVFVQQLEWLRLSESDHHSKNNSRRDEYQCPDIPSGIIFRKQKARPTAKRSAAFTKIAREIIVAVKAGGSGDPKNNSRLATVITKAKAVNMPKDNIKRTMIRRWPPATVIVTKTSSMRAMAPPVLR